MGDTISLDQFVTGATTGNIVYCLVFVLLGLSLVGTVAVWRRLGGNALQTMVHDGPEDGKNLAVLNEPPSEPKPFYVHKTGKG